MAPHRYVTEGAELTAGKRVRICWAGDRKDFILQAIFADAEWNKGAIRPTDGGATWMQINIGLANLNVRPIPASLYQTVFEDIYNGLYILDNNI